MTRLQSAAERLIQEGAEYLERWAEAKCWCPCKASGSGAGHASLAAGENVVRYQMICTAGSGIDCVCGYGTVAFDAEGRIVPAGCRLTEVS